MTQLQNPTPLAAPDQADKSLAPLPKGGNSAADQVKVTAVTHWTDKLFSFQTNRPPSFLFQSGEFAMIGLADNDGKVVTRAYPPSLSTAPANVQQELNPQSTAA